MASSTIVLDARNVVKKYGAIAAVDNVDLSVRAGEFVALLGSNGAGKSTLLQILAGLFAPDSGSVSLLGSDMANSAVKALRNIGVVFQQPTLDLELSVRANLYYHADLHGIPRKIAKQRIAWALDRFGLSERARDRTGVLSGGNRRRVELARALLHRPSLLLMDEATIGLDPASRREILEDIVKLKRNENLGVLWTTHLVDEMSYADRIMILRSGKVKFDGSADALIEREGTKDLAPAIIKVMGGDPAKIALETIQLS